MNEDPSPQRTQRRDKRQATSSEGSSHYKKSGCLPTHNLPTHVNVWVNTYTFFICVGND
ncbi:hypothetical protein HanXRQr2_Chr03g0125881 [Helianthus annuus]|uniref:Uncharacterized protein n=1 Tax=Helianthus annuus TaxID=4232 RepID=A0A9K3NWA7_HELAN|nr:hypothetical protein HanXRQr2_Chr03g0125881 [Helianthus annuus]KAJ0944948.1 hypothetical protein HanPSC8_Chr03g0122461 [Helianthus annuus]